MNFADQEEIAERQKRRNQKRQSNLIWNIFTAFFVVISLMAIGFFALLFADPSNSLNPYPPPTLPAIIQLPTSTPTLVKFPATWTPTITSTMAPTQTPSPIVAITTLPVNPTPTPFVTDNNSQYPFANKGDAAAVANTVFHPDSNCNWQGIAGQVWDIQGTGLVGYRVHLQGVYNGEAINQITLSGGAQAWYGNSGYEFVIGNTPINSTGQLTVQLEDQSGLPLSNKVTVNTYADCSKNLVLVNFQQVR